MIEPNSNLVLFADESILVVNKPANVSVIHDSFRPDDITFVDQLKSDYGPLWVVHRLDRETSGVMIFARTKEAHHFLNEQFQARQVKKIYNLLACGGFSWRKIDVNLPLEVDGDRKHRTIVNFSSGKPAQTEFVIMQEFAHDLFLIQASPMSGYTHQIRAHLSTLNGMILNDLIYRPHPIQKPTIPTYNPDNAEEWARTNLPILRLALHAVSISFTHPDKHEIITLTAPYPDDFNKSLQILKTTGQSR